MSEDIKRFNDHWNDVERESPGLTATPTAQLAAAIGRAVDSLATIAEQHSKELSAVRTELEELKKRFDGHTHPHFDPLLERDRETRPPTSHHLKEGETVHFPDSAPTKNDD